MDLDGILADVTQVKVAGLLQQRQPLILEEGDPVQEDRFGQRVRGAAVQVLTLVGPDPVPGVLRTLAEEAIALETGSGIEYAEFPESQIQGEDGRGYYLHRRYLELLVDLTKFVTLTRQVPQKDGSVFTPLLPNQMAPLGDFPPPNAYPDPAATGWTGWPW